MIDGIGLFIFVAIVRFFSTYSWSAKTAAFLAIGINFALAKTLAVIHLPKGNSMVSELLAPGDIAIAALQLIVAFIAFSIMSDKEDDLVGYFVVAIIAASINYTLIPFTIPAILPF